MFYGISMSIVPVVGYHLGQANKKELHSLWHNGMILMAAFGLIVTGFSIVLAEPIARIFVGYNETLTALSEAGASAGAPVPAPARRARSL